MSKKATVRSQYGFNKHRYYYSCFELLRELERIGRRYGRPARTKTMVVMKLTAISFTMMPILASWGS